jgi:hypothetical protein
MAIQFGLWKLNKNIQTPSLEAQIMQQEGFIKLLKAQLQAGRVNEVHSYLEGVQATSCMKGRTNRLLKTLQCGALMSSSKFTGQYQQ